MLSARRCPVRGVTRVEGVLSKERRIILINLPGPASRSSGQSFPRFVFCFRLLFVSRRGPFFISPHSHSPLIHNNSRLRVEHRRWFLEPDLKTNNGDSSEFKEKRIRKMMLSTCCIGGLGLSFTVFFGGPKLTGLCTLGLADNWWPTVSWVIAGSLPPTSFSQDLWGRGSGSNNVEGIVFAWVYRGPCELAGACSVISGTTSTSSGGGGQATLLKPTNSKRPEWHSCKPFQDLQSATKDLLLMATWAKNKIFRFTFHYFISNFLWRSLKIERSFHSLNLLFTEKPTFFYSLFIFYLSILGV